MFASQLTVSDGISACSSASRAEENQKKYSIFNRCPRWRRSDILVVLRFVRWLVLKNTHHSFNRSDAITTWSFAFSRATGYLVVLYFELSLVPCKVDLGSDWLDLWLCVFISIIDQIAQYRYKHNFLSTRQYTKFIPFLVIFKSALSSSFMQLNLCSKGKLWRKKQKNKNAESYSKPNNSVLLNEQAWRVMELTCRRNEPAVVGMMTQPWIVITHKLIQWFVLWSVTANNGHKYLLMSKQNDK